MNIFTRSAVKDPSVIRYQDRWHLFCTLRKLNGGNGKPPGYLGWRLGLLEPVPE